MVFGGSFTRRKGGVQILRAEKSTEAFQKQKLNLIIERDHIILWKKINIKLFKEQNDVSSIEEKLRKTGLYNPDNNEASHRGRSSRIEHDSEKAGINSPDENRETCKLIREVPRYHATEAYQARDMRVDAVIIHPP